VNERKWQATARGGYIQVWGEIESRPIPRTAEAAEWPENAESIIYLSAFSGSKERLNLMSSQNLNTPQEAGSRATTVVRRLVIISVNNITNLLAASLRNIKPGVDK
jgi:hypothetical protein